MIITKNEIKDYKNFLNQFVKEYSGKIMLCICISIFSMFCIMLNPIASRYIIDNVLLLKNVSLLYIVLGILSVVTIFSAIIHFVFSYILNKIFVDIGKNYKTFIFNHILNLDIVQSNKISIGQMNSRLFNDTEILKVSFAQIVFGGIFNIILIVIAIIYMSIMNWKLTLFVVLGQSLQGFLLYYFPQKIKVVNSEKKQLYENIMNRTLEIFDSLNLLKSCNSEKREIKRFSKALDLANDKSIKENFLVLFFSEFSSLITAIIQFAVIGYGGWLVAYNKLTLGELTAFIVLTNMLSSPLSSIISVVSEFEDSLVSLNRISEITKLKKSYSTKEIILDRRLNGDISIKELNFQYEIGNTILKNINLDLKAKGIYSIIGKSGVGKSTLCMLISRFYEPTAGDIFIDGINIKDINIECYRRNVGILLQNSFMFSGTVKENILLGKLDATDEEIFESAILANAHEFISKLPDGYYTKIGNDGQRLSAGQLQRIALARLFLQKPSIIILDEPTSFIDIESEEFIKKSIIELSKQSTIIMITHKLETAKIADEIILLDEGKIKEVGSHSELLDKNGIYNKLYRSVLSN